MLTEKTKTKMKNMRKYRIIEENYEHVSHFYPQYKDENGKDIKSEYQYFGKFEDCGLVGNKQWKKDVFYDMSNARLRIEMDIQEHTTEELKETIVHEY